MKCDAALADSIAGFKAIVEGDMDEVPEALFYMAGAIDDVKERFEQSEKAK